jgi:hypothetical protein
MRAFLKFVFSLLALAVVVLGAAWWWAGRQAGPTIVLRQPGAFIGQTSSLEMMVEAPQGKFTAVDVTVEQGDKSYSVFTLDQPAQGGLKQESASAHSPICSRDRPASWYTPPARFSSVFGT